MPAGRPKSDGRQPGWMLYRDHLILSFHAPLRQKGLGKEGAIKETVRLIKEKHPEMDISATAVRKALALHQPVKLLPGGGVFLAEEIENKLVVSFGERPDFGKQGQQKTRNKIEFGGKKVLT